MGTNHSDLKLTTNNTSPDLALNGTLMSPVAQRVSRDRMVLSLVNMLPGTDWEIPW